jgi:hypothetical protein
MNMIGHHYKAKTTALLVSQLYAKEMDDDAFCLAVIQQSPSPVAGKSHKIGMPFTNKDLAPHPLLALHLTRSKSTLLPFGYWQPIASATPPSSDLNRTAVRPMKACLINNFLADSATRLGAATLFGSLLAWHL